MNKLAKKSNFAPHSENHMKKTGFFLIVLAFGMATSATAQTMSYGFRAGISFSKFIGDSEMNDAGESLEAYNFASGFHIGVSANLGLTDEFGFRGELLFSQTGTEYEYDGDSYYFLARGQTDEKLVFGNRKVDQSVSRATLELPIIAYYKLGFVEISGGFYGALQMASTGGGSLSMTEVTSAAGNDVDPFDITLQHNYNKDGAGQAGFRTEEIEVDGSTIPYSRTTGAYYNYDFKDKNLYQTFDFGLAGGIALYLNDGLYVSARATYGLLDVDRNEYDISYHKLEEDREYIQRADKNVNFTIQASVGFLF